MAGVNWSNSSKVGGGLIHSSCNPQVKSQPHWEFYHCLQKKKDCNLCVILFSYPVNLLTAKELGSALPWGRSGGQAALGTRNVELTLWKNCQKPFQTSLCLILVVGGFLQLLFKTAELQNFQIQAR